jgi:hypothetical protein
MRRADRRLGATFPEHQPRSADKERVRRIAMTARPSRPLGSVSPRRAAFAPAGAALMAAIVLAAGCYRPQGAMMPGPGAAATYYSTEALPKTVKLIDLRTGETVFTMDIPAGKQLTLDFLADEGDDQIGSPDLMRYELFDLGTETGKLRSSMSVPGAVSRRIDVFIRQGPEYALGVPDRPLRTDELIDRPDWWTPRGGPLPPDPYGKDAYRK